MSSPKKQIIIDNSKNESNELHKKSISNCIKLGLLSQQSSFININDLLNSYLKEAKIETYKIKDQFHYEFTPLCLPNLIITINNLRTFQNIYNKYKVIDFFIIMIDIQNKKSMDYVDEAVNSVIDAGDINYTKKCFIFGFYIDNEKKCIQEERIETILDAKGIDYYYREIKIDDITMFSKVMELILNNCNTIKVEKFLEQKHSELVLDNSNSKCNIF